ncbi:hypothetical protein NQ318_010424 [Aromia moschata]|uniref:PiggyBac transposable element-derived protein domain-containing protein n=1 Tax=Aromia moschata TaxID=1265417 RepID=A0AAV8X743_9CUCU|nr:hypothetical protein NQ318_010424 [Aromia moschata]
MPLPPKIGAYYTTAELEEILTQSDSEDDFIAGDVSDDSGDEIEAQVLEQLLTSPRDGSEVEEDAEEEPEKINENVSWAQVNIVPHIFPFDSITGYILDFIIYTGATTETAQSNFGKSGDVVVTPLDPYLDEGHTLFIDNWYSSPDLFLWLYDRCTNACGTVRKTRKQMPKMEEKLKGGEFTFRTTRNRLIAIKWCDKREVFMLSTAHDNNVAATGKTDRTTNLQIMKPECIIEYNKRMGAVDKTDMLLSSVGKYTENN